MAGKKKADKKGAVEIDKQVVTNDKKVAKADKKVAAEKDDKGSVEPAEKAEGGNPSSAQAEIFQQIIWLLSQSQTHRFMFIADLEWAILPPYRLRQFRIFRNSKTPMALATWAAVSDPVLERMKRVGPRLRPNEWNSGKNIVLMDVVAPFGGLDKVVEELNNTVFKGGKAITLADLRGRGKAGDEEGKG